MTKQLITADMKLLALQYVKEGLDSTREICEKYAMSSYRIKSWRTKFETGGLEALTPTKQNKFYSKELKQRAVEDDLTEKYSIYEILSTYEISSWSLFKSWFKIYTSHSELKDSGKGISHTMTKGRKNGRRTHWNRKSLPSEWEELSRDSGVICGIGMATVLDNFFKVDRLSS